MLYVLLDLHILLLFCMLVFNVMMTRSEKTNPSTILLKHTEKDSPTLLSRTLTHVKMKVKVILKTLKQSKELARVTMSTFKTKQNPPPRYARVKMRVLR